MNNELATIPAAQLAPATIGVLDVINNAVVNNASVEVLERLYALLERQNAAQAKVQFDEAMAGFQGECPVIAKSADGARTRSGGVAYHYAPLDKIVSAVRGLLAKYGLSYSFDTVNTQNSIQVICTVKHIGGHSERSTVEFRLGTKTDIMSMTQQDAATVTYNKRYAFCNAFGIMTGDSDTDLVDRSIYDEPAYKITNAPNGQANSNSPQYKPPAQRTPDAKPVGEVLATTFEMPMPAGWQVIAGNSFVHGKAQQGIKLTVTNGLETNEVWYYSLPKAQERSGLATPWDYRGIVTFDATKERGPQMFDIENLHFPELEATNV